MEGPLSDLPIRFRENRDTAGRIAALSLAFGLMSLWLHYSYAMHPSEWAHVSKHATIPIIAPIGEIISLFGLRWSLPAAILAPTFFEIREGGLWFARFGLVPWSSIGRLELKPIVLKSVIFRDTTHLRVEVTDLPDRIRALPWWSRVGRWMISSPSDTSIVPLGGARLTRPAAEVAELIEAHRPPKAGTGATP